MTDPKKSDLNQTHPGPTIESPDERFWLFPRPLGDILLALLSGLMLAVAFLAPSASWLGWVALVPLFLTLRERDPRGNFFMGCLVGIPWFLISCHWIRHVTWGGLLALSAFEGVWLGFWLMLAGRFHARWRLFILPTLWVAAEMLRSKGSLGFSWNLMGHLAPGEMLPMAQVWGVYGLSFAIVAFNATVACYIIRDWRHEEWLRMPEGAGFFLGLPVIWLIVGALVFRSAEPPRPIGELRVGLVQGNFEQSLKWQVPVSDAVTRYVELTNELVRDTRPDLIVWPEVAVPAVLSEDPGLLGYLGKCAAAWRTPLYFGTMDRDMRTAGENGPLYNSAVYLDPARIAGLPEPVEPQLVSYRLRGTDVHTPKSSVLPSVIASPRTSELVVYDKARLLQFGEYVPFNRLIPFIQRYVETRGGGAYSMGTIGRVLSTRFGDLGTLICSESTFSGLARRSVLNGAVLLVNMTNDAWYKMTAAPRQHALQSQFRAIETGRAVVRVANTGWTRVYLPDGSVRGEIPWFTTGAETIEVPLYSHLTFQTRVGDFLGWLCLVCLGLSLLISRERAPEEDDSPEDKESLAESTESG